MSTAVMELDVLMRTYDNKFTMPEWWDLTVKAQASRGKSKILKKFVCRGDLVFDVGANRGVMTLTFRQLGARVVAVEPLFDAAPHLVREFAWRFREDTDVIPVKRAVSDRVGNVKISVHNNLPYLSSCGNAWMTQSAHAKMYNDVACKSVNVATTTLDALIDRFGVPEFIKLDVEGYEGTAIKGLSTPVNAISFEFHEDWLHDSLAVMEHLGGIGNYEYNYALDNRGVMILPEYVEMRQLMARLRMTLTKSGKGSWGDIYAKLA